MYFSTEPPVATGLPFYKTVVCLTCVLILIINGVSLFLNLGSLKGANEIQGQTAKVIDKVQYVNVLIMDAESSLRGYFLSGSEVYLGPLRTASSEIDAQFGELDRLLADSPSQRRNLAQLHTLVYRRLDTMNQVLDVYRQGGLADILKIAGTSDSKAEMDEIRLQVVILVQEQNELLSARSATFYREYQHAVFLGISINAMAILVLALFYRLIRRSYFARATTQRALENANDNLESMVVLRTEQLSVLSRHLISVSEEEKARLARELHDELGANLTSINIDMNAVADTVRATQPALAVMLDRARATLVDTVELKRRIVEDLRPSLLDHLGLSAAVQSYCEEFGRVTGLDCEALIDGDVDVAGPMHAIAVFRIVQESLNNIAKYAQARQVIVHLGREAGGLSLEVSDDGVGIESEAVAKPKSHGLLGMRERALLLGGSLRVKRGVNNLGTCVEAFIPLSRVADSGDNGNPAPQDPTPLPFSGLHPSEGDRTRSLRPYSIRRHTPPGPDGQSP
ncbi:CHASE3 domain-containing protein [Massilia sp. DJPM01]|uniref:CHASE3 domain-containing protein n=1 Tax=Massilia sp. DJPM01 TaxID=3024404 RepID=UPI00259E52D5|nr:CHASE3 domain-containing protein [Massilia sp. DJPM01]MDM5177513.1 CHASE3 domain-containing protein [Massilia sp. DJPM01]